MMTRTEVRAGHGLASLSSPSEAAPVIRTDTRLLLSRGQFRLQGPHSPETRGRLHLESLLMLDLQEEEGKMVLD